MVEKIFYRATVVLKKFQKNGVLAPKCQNSYINNKKSKAKLRSDLLLSLFCVAFDIVSNALNQASYSLYR